MISFQSFLDELTKIAEEGMDPMTTGAALAGGGLAANMAGVAGVRHLAPVKGERAATLTEALKSKSPVPVLTPQEFDPELPGLMKKMVTPDQIPEAERVMKEQMEKNLKGNAVFAPDMQRGGKPVIVMGEGLTNRPDVLAHEMGHASIHKNPLGRVLQNKLTSGMGTIGTSMPVAALAGGLTGLSDNETVQAAGRWAPAIAATPMLAYEGLASGLALRKLRRAGATWGEVGKSLGSLGPAWGSYAGRAALGTGVSHLSQLGVKNLRGEPESKTADIHSWFTGR